MTTSNKKGLYRSRNGMILGVCKGLAEYFNFSLGWTRTLVVVSTLFTGFWPMVGLYIIGALVMKPNPVIPLGSIDEEEFYDTYVHSRRSAIIRLKSRFESVEKRIRRMEDIVTAKEFDWERRFNA